ncbi:MAG: ATP-binding cassette domain-containing protein [Acidobacteriota bacterium]
MKRRRWLVPEVVQTSAMDCGPATLKCLLEGHGIPVSYGRLREACQVDVDGTSIDTMEQLAKQVGLAAEQVMLPTDHVLLDSAKSLPAIVVMRAASGATHFMLAWRRYGPFIQVMDPAKGRRWMTRTSFAAELHAHVHPVPAAAWRAWAGSESFTDPLRDRLATLGVSRSVVDSLLAEVSAEPDWFPFGCLDAVTRLATELQAAGGLPSGRAGAFVRTLLKQVRAEPDDALERIPASYWSVLPSSPGAEGPPEMRSAETLGFRGAVLVRVDPDAPLPVVDATGDDEPTGNRLSPDLPPEVAAALREGDAKPGRRLLAWLREESNLSWLALVTGSVVAAAGVLLELLLFRGLLELGRWLESPLQQVAALGLFSLLLIGLLLLELPLVGTLLRFGRHLETRMRLALHETLPRIADRYFQSRPASDMTERAHALHRLRLLPDLGGQVLRTALLLAFTTAGIIWLDPRVLVPALVGAACAPVLAWLAQPWLAERDLRVRNHGSALSRFHVDSLLGLVPIRLHGAERALRREHEGLLVEWARANLAHQRGSVLVDATQALLGFGATAWIVATHLTHAGATPSVLLLLYWALRLPVLGQTLTQLLVQGPQMRNITLRLLEPLGAPEVDEAQPATDDPGGADAGASPADAPGVTIELDGVTVRAGGHVLLSDVSLELAAGEQVALVGASGAGKSSLVGLLLGLHRAATGTVLIDGRPLDTTTLRELRRQVAWVDPSVHLWNRSLLENLRYGNDDEGEPLDRCLDDAELLAVLERLPDGLSTELGESGGLVSGGEGQRVRLGRALLSGRARLVLLDEALRGLDRSQRRRLLARARERWAGATLICVTHDLEASRDFERVLVLEGGRLVEQGSPSELHERQDSRYRALLDRDADNRNVAWAAAAWRRVELRAGTLLHDLPSEEP